MAARAEALRIDGNAAFTGGDFAAALQLYTSSIDLAPSPSALSNRSVTLLKLGRPLDALDDADAAVAMDGAFLRARLRVAQALHGVHDILAASAADAALRKAPSGDPLIRELKAIAGAPNRANLMSAGVNGPRPRSSAPLRGIGGEEQAEPEGMMVRACFQCGKFQDFAAKEDRFKRCSKCFSVSFCSEACRDAGWGRHKASCAVTTRALALEKEGGVTLGLDAARRSARLLNDYIIASSNRYAQFMVLAWALQHNRAPWGDSPGASMIFLLAEVTTPHVLRVQFVPLALLRPPQYSKDARVLGAGRLSKAQQMADDDIIDKLSRVRGPCQFLGPNVCHRRIQPVCLHHAELRSSFFRCNRVPRSSRHLLLNVAACRRLNDARLPGPASLRPA